MSGVCNDENILQWFRLEKSLNTFLLVKQFIKRISDYYFLKLTLSFSLAETIIFDRYHTHEVPDYTLADYENGFGFPTTEYYFLGLKNLYRMTATPKELTVAAWCPLHDRQYFINFRMLDNATGSFKYTYESKSGSMEYSI